ncbi:uncharacterized protein LOC119673539, partial [Teleopsis dalmanni]|uniref:uncharacterized protein LOC119667649 n=1 Tax=Teleopsis dalmanni TaxID=139649 RepID=UPI0018CDBCFC
MSTNKNVTVWQTSNMPLFSPRIETWSIWKKKLEIHICVLNCEDDKKKAILLKAIGAEPYSILHSMCSPTPPIQRSYKELCEIIKSHYTPPTIILQERKKFHEAFKHERESVSEWFARVKKLALDSKFEEHLNAFILDRF